MAPLEAHPVLTAAPNGTHRATGAGDGDIDSTPSAPADRPDAASPQRSMGGDTPEPRTEAAEGRDAPADRPDAASPQRSMGGDTPEPRTEAAEGRDAPRVLPGAATGAPSEVATPWAPSVTMGRATTGLPTMVVTPGSARLRCKRSLQIRVVDAATGGPAEHR
jgi:hypothetical protein